MSIEKAVKDAMKADKAVFGTKKTIKFIKMGEIAAVIWASNCPRTTLKDLDNYSKIGNFKIEEFGGDSVKLGEICGKPFNILIIGIKS